MSSYRPRAIGWLGVLATLAFMAPPAAAQQVATAAVEPVATDTFLVLVPYRSTETIRSDLERVRQGRESAKREREASKSLESRADAVIEIQKREIEVIKAREELAKREKREADRAAEKTRRQQAELAKKMLEKRRELRAAEGEVAEAEEEAAEARENALEAELELADRRAQHDRLSLSDSARARELAREMIELERRTLRARIDAAAKERDYAERARRLAERRLSLYDAQEKLAGAIR